MVIEYDKSISSSVAQKQILIPVFNTFFRLKRYRQRTLRFLFGDCRFIYFHSLMKSAFLVSRGAIVFI